VTVTIIFDTSVALNSRECMAARVKATEVTNATDTTEITETADGTNVGNTV